MSLRTVLVIALALVFGISSAMGIGLMVSKGDVAVEMVSIAVASADIPRFLPISEASVTWKEVPKTAVPPGALTSMEEVVKRAPRIDINEQDYILDHMLAKKGSKTVAAVIPDGKVAIPIQGSNVSGFVQPGDRVDVHFTIKQRSGKYKSVTVFTMVDVMAVNGSLESNLDAKSDGKEPQSVTLLLSQDEARELDEGQKQGMIRLTLRNFGDKKPAAVTRLADLKEDVETVAIAVATTDVGRLVPIKEANVEWKQVPKEMVPPGALTRIEDVLEREPRIEIGKHDYILDHMLSKKGSKTENAVIPPGKRAYPIQASNVSGFVQPGDRVDVILTLEKKSGEIRSLTVLTMVDVMAVNGSLVPTYDAKSEGKEPHSVTLLLTQEEAKELEEGRKKGTIRLTLRNFGDKTPALVTKLADVNWAEPPEEPKANEANPIRQQPVAQIRTLRGTQAGLDFPGPAPEKLAK